MKHAVEKLYQIYISRFEILQSNVELSKKKRMIPNNELFWTSEESEANLGNKGNIYG